MDTGAVDVGSEPIVCCGGCGCLSALASARVRSPTDSVRIICGLLDSSAELAVAVAVTVAVGPSEAAMPTLTAAVAAAEAAETALASAEFAVDCCCCC